MDVSSIDIQNIETEWLTDKQLLLDVLRLDKMHPVVSGNKWFKLQYYLKDAVALKKNTVATFGGAWSNHIVATACAAGEAGLKSVGIIRGEKPVIVSATIKMAMEYGMELHYVTREQYRQKDGIRKVYSNDWFWIDEGGYGSAGATGAAEILKIVDTSNYSHIIAAVGTGTMLAGLIQTSLKKQKVIGINSMKGNFAIEQKIKDLIKNEAAEKPFEIKHEYHFGGYGKHPQELLAFINDVYLTSHLPLDIVYTGKTFFAIKDLALKNVFDPGSSLLMIHSGGLQGNKSLPAKVLAF